MSDLREKVYDAINSCASSHDVERVTFLSINICMEEASKECERHKGKYRYDGPMSDGWSCSCGWESPSYFDGSEFAHADFERHRAESIRTLAN